MRKQTRSRRQLAAPTCASLTSTAGRRLFGSRHAKPAQPKASQPCVSSAGSQRASAPASSHQACPFQRTPSRSGCTRTRRSCPIGQPPCSGRSRVTKKLLDHCIERWILRALTPGQQAKNLWVGISKEALKGRLLIRRCTGVPNVNILHEQHIQLAHATATAPPQSPHVDRLRRQAYRRRTASICLISPIARAGLRSFGQAFVQFMIVWQR